MNKEELINFLKDNLLIQISCDEEFPKFKTPSIKVTVSLKIKSVDDSVIDISSDTERFFFPH